MYGVCPHCSTNHYVEIKAEKEMGVNYVKAECIVCGTEFKMLKRKIYCPHCEREMYIVPQIVEKDKIQLIYENYPQHIKDEYW